MIVLSSIVQILVQSNILVKRKYPLTGFVKKDFWCKKQPAGEALLLRVECLHINQPLIKSLPGDQFTVRSLLYDSPRLKHDNMIGILDRTQAMGYDQARAMTHEVGKCILHNFFRLG